MRPGREVDAEIAKKVFGHRVWSQAKVLYENAEKGDRPLRNYSKEMEWAWEVAKHLRMTILPIGPVEWFVFVGPAGQTGWDSPTAALEFLNSGEFEGCGAAVGDNLPLLICQAALKAMEKRSVDLQVIDTEQAAPPEPSDATPAELHVVPTDSNVH
jgi:hypothetical protein